MEISRSRTDKFGNRGCEGNNVMPHLGFNCIDPINRERGFRFDPCRGFLRNDAFLRKYFCCGEFDIEPSLVFVLVFPDASHSRACVTWYHFLTITESVLLVDPDV